VLSIGARHDGDITLDTSPSGGATTVIVVAVNARGMNLEDASVGKDVFRKVSLPYLAGCAIVAKDGRLDRAAGHRGVDGTRERPEGEGQEHERLGKSHHGRRGLSGC
jgi:hypothetical protein